MGANAGTAVPVYASGEVLTAARLNLTNCGVPVFSGTATRDAAFGGSGEKVLAEGQLCYLEDANVVQYYDSASWLTVGPQTLNSGLQYITGSSFTTATSVSLPNSTFSSTYRNYRMIFQITAAANDADITLRLRASGSDITSGNYDNTWTGLANTGGGSNITSVSATSWNVGEIDTTAPWCYMAFDIIAPQVATNTFLVGSYAFVDKTGTSYITRTGSGVFRLTTQVDALTVISSVASSMTGVYRVYGYSES